MTTTIQYIVFEQPAYITSGGYLIFADNQKWHVARGIVQDDLILIFA